MNDWVDRAISEVPQLARGRVWCTGCGASLKVNVAWCLFHGWPSCCGQTMTIDSPEELAAMVHTMEVDDD